MVLDNDSTGKREGSEVTYKHKKGFQPLHICQGSLEQLPFKSFKMNRTYYFMLVLTHFIFEAYKQDVTALVIPVTVYPNTFRRKLIDFAAKITSRARSIVLNVTKTVYQTINIEELWKRCQSQRKYSLRKKKHIKKSTQKHPSQIKQFLV